MDAADDGSGEHYFLHLAWEALGLDPWTPIMVPKRGVVELIWT